MRICCSRLELLLVKLSSKVRVRLRFQIAKYTKGECVPSYFALWKLQIPCLCRVRQRIRPPLLLLQLFLDQLFVTYLVRCVPQSIRYLMKTYDSRNSFYFARHSYVHNCSNNQETCQNNCQGQFPGSKTACCFRLMWFHLFRGKADRY